MLGEPLFYFLSYLEIGLTEKQILQRMSLTEVGCRVVHPPDPATQSHGWLFHQSDSSSIVETLLLLDLDIVPVQLNRNN